MSDTAIAIGPERFEVRTTSDSHFSWVRTRLSVERTLMSWVRTATALIGFGFTIFQFLDRFSATAGVAPAARPMAPWILSLALICAGTAALAFALWQYDTMVKDLWRDRYRAIAGVGPAPGHSPVMAVAILLIIAGLFAFGAVLLRVE